MISKNTNSIIRLELTFIYFLAISMCGCITNEKTNSNDNTQSSPAAKNETYNKTSPNQIELNDQGDLNLALYENRPLNIDSQIDSFIQSTLKQNQRYHSKEDLKKNDIAHIKIFDQTGLTNYYAYSDKRYPQSDPPTEYDHFTLFVLEYDNETSASNSFKTVYRHSKLDRELIDSLRVLDPQLLNSIATSLKPGGLICHRNNYIFSLVKTCRKPPFNIKWDEYEQLFINCISSDNILINTLNAKCGKMKYRFEKRKFINS